MGDLDLRQLPVDALRPNPWNPNRMDAATMRAERESIAEYGFIDPVTVRPRPPQADDGPRERGRELWQIIDGEHRILIAGELGLAEVPAVVLVVSDIEAERLTLILNEAHGEPDSRRLGQLLAELQERMGERLHRALRWSPREVRGLIDLSHDWPAWAASTFDAPPPEGGFVLDARVDAEHRELFESVAAAEGFDNPADPELVGRLIRELADG